MAKSFDELAVRTMTKQQRERAKKLARQDLAVMLLKEVRKLRGLHPPSPAV